MAIFLTVGCVELLLTGTSGGPWQLAADFTVQIIGGAVLGVGAGFLLVWLINRLELAAGLYPVLAMAFALFTFGLAQVIGTSGFMAVYFAGLVVGNRRHRATQLIERFHDGLAWLAQMVMFVMLGLLVTPSDLLPILIPAVLIARLPGGDRPADGGGAVPAALPLRLERARLRRLGGAARRGRDLPRHDPGAVRPRGRLDLLRGGVRGGPGLADRAGLDAGARRAPVERRAAAAAAARPSGSTSTCRPRAIAIS